MSLFQDLEVEDKSDSDDEEYIPTGEIESEEEGSEDDVSEEELSPTKINGKSSRRTSRKKSQKRKANESDDEASKSKNIKPDETEEEKKKKSDDLWAQFLGQPSSATKNTDLPTKKTVDSSSNDVKRIEREASKTDSSSAEFNKLNGESLTQKSITSPSNLSTKNSSQPSPLICGSSAKFSLGNNKSTSSSVNQSNTSKNLLSLLGKKPQKVSILEKSKSDWNTFKEKEGIADDLKIYNRGKNGYLERKAFEARTDERQFELEKDWRMKTRKL